MDFMRDSLVSGQPYRIWTLVDDATREAPLLIVDRSLPARRVVEALDMLLLIRLCPSTIVCDNGPEFVSQTLDVWAADHHVRLEFIRPGRPVENSFIESFNGKLRDECLNQRYFASLADARMRHRSVAAGVQHRTTTPRTPAATPAEFAARFSPQDDEELITTLRRRLGLSRGKRQRVRHAGCDRAVLRQLYDPQRLWTGLGSNQFSPNFGECGMRQVGARRCGQDELQ